MPRKETMIQLSDEMLIGLDREARRRGLSRSAVVREAVQKYLARSEEQELIRRWIEGYKRVPPAEVDEWGDLEAQTAANARAARRELDEEERRAELEPW